MKRHFLFYACCLLAVGLASCSDDEGDGSTSQGNQAMTTPDLSQIGIRFPVTSINYYNGDFSVFNYDSDGKMESGTTFGDIGIFSPDFQIEHNPLAIYVKDGIDSGSYWPYTDIMVNDKGFATSITCKAHDGTDLYSMEYDAEGHITKLSVNENDGEMNDNYAYTWNNGNLTRVVWKMEDTRNPGDPSFNVLTMEFEYGEGQPNPGIYLSGSIELDDEWDIMWYTGLFGKTTKDIPTAYTESSLNSNRKYTYTVVPHYNENGSVASLEVVSSKDGYTDTFTTTFGYDGQPAAKTGMAPARKTLKAGRRTPHRKAKSAPH